MTKSVPSPTTFLLVVKVGASMGQQDISCTFMGLLATTASPFQGEQADLARYSVTQVTVEARNAAGSQPHFPQSLYRGTVAAGSGAGVAVKDAASPSQPLRIWAQDPDFPVCSPLLPTQEPCNLARSLGLLTFVGGLGVKSGSSPGLTAAIPRTSTRPSPTKSPTAQSSGWMGRRC